MLADKTVVLGITGSISAYKSADLASKLTRDGANVEVIMTESATRFIAPLTLRNLTGRPVVTGMWELTSEFSVEHIALAEAGSIDAMRYLADIYQKGEGMKKDLAKSRYWSEKVVVVYQEEAAAGAAHAMKQLASIYLHVEPIKSSEKWKEWMVKAAEAGDVNAMVSLGNSYRYGRNGLAKNMERSLFWTRKSAESGS